VLETADAALIEAIKNAGLIGLCVNGEAHCNATFDSEALPIDEIYNGLKDRKIIY
jgi:bifunctional enzyme CysN/CysC